MSECIILDWRESFNRQPVYGLVAPTASSLLTLSPPMAVGLGVILLFGLGSIGLAQLEKKMIERQMPYSQYVTPITLGILLLGGFIGFFYLVLHNPLWKVIR